MDAKEIHHNFCQNLRHLRKVHNLTQKEMAGILGISVSTLGRMESMDEKVRINCRILCRVCDHFGYSTDEILRQNWPRMLLKKSLPLGEGGSPKG